MAAKRILVVPGFILFELIIALTLIGATLLFIGQWSQHRQQIELRQGWLNDTEKLIEIVGEYWRQQAIMPSDLSQLPETFGIEQLQTPWQRIWQLAPQGQTLMLTMEAPSSAEASWFAGRLAGAQVVGQQLQVTILPPLFQRSGSPERYLHRIAVPSQPELNQLEVHLDLNGFDVTNVGLFDGTDGRLQNVQSTTLASQSLVANRLTVDTINVGDLVTPNGDLREFMESLDRLQALWDSCVAQGGCSAF